MHGMNIAETLVAGIVAIGLVTAFGLHASGLSAVTKAGGTQATSLFSTAEKG